MDINPMRSVVSALLSASVMLVVLLVVPAKLRAQETPAYFQTSVSGQSSAAPGTITETTTNGYGTETSSATTTANLSVSASGIYTGPDTYSSTLGSFGKATIDYYYDVMSPTGVPIGSTLVPMTISADLTTTATGFDSSADTSVVISYEYQPGVSGFIGDIGAITGCNVSACSSTSGVFGVAGTAGNLNLVDLPFDAYADNPVSVELVSESSIDYGGGTASATIDPIVAIDPSWLAENPGFTLLVSSNVTQTSPVPLSASAWLLLSGLGGLAFIGRRRITPTL